MTASRLPLASVESISPEPGPATLINNCLVASVHHLLGVRPLVMSGRADRYTVLSMLRGALLGASHAGWIVAAGKENAGTWIARSLGYRLHLMQEELKCATEIGQIPGASMATRKDRLEGRISALEDEAAEKDWKISEVQSYGAIQSAVRAVDDDPETAARILLTWRECSSAAHAFSWHLESRSFGRRAQRFSSDHESIPLGITADEFREKVGPVLGLATTYVHIFRDLSSPPEQASE